MNYYSSQIKQQIVVDRIKQRDYTRINRNGDTEMRVERKSNKKHPWRNLLIFTAVLTAVVILKLVIVGEL